MPAAVNAVAGDGQVTISWDGVSGATSYNLYWSTVSGVNKATGTKISNVTSPHTHAGRINGTTYYYVATAQNALGESIESSQVSATPGQPPSPPTGVNAAAGDGQVIISWDSVSGATIYNLYWSTSPGVSKVSYTEKISNVSSPFTHSGRINGTTYYYVVTAVNNYGESGESTQVSATPGQPPSPPAGISATAGNKQVTISWNGVAGATSYNLYWSTVPGVNKGTGTKISGVISPYTHTGRTNNTTYYYVVTAVNGYGESSESIEVSARPPGH
jgi:fibronectin type 3 domain-containing protein